MASANLMKILRKKPTVQVGDPFTENFNGGMFELMKDNSIISYRIWALQD